MMLLFAWLPNNYQAGLATRSIKSYLTTNMSPWHKLTHRHHSLQDMSGKYLHLSAPVDLIAISQTPLDRAVTDYESYVFKKYEGLGTFIYHAELGIDSDYLDFADSPVEWLFMPLTIRIRADTNTEFHISGRFMKGHSTCGASKARGRLCGSAKAATLGAVKAQSGLISASEELFTTIAKDIDDRHRQARSVVTISWGSSSDSESIKEGIQWLKELRVPVFCAAGNKGETHQFVNQYPARIEEDVIVVGNTDASGK